MVILFVWVLFQYDLNIVHEQTGRNLHSHQIPAPFSTHENEVSCYGNATIGDSFDHWKVEIVDV